MRFLQSLTCTLAIFLSIFTSSSTITSTAVAKSFSSLCHITPVATLPFNDDSHTIHTHALLDGHEVSMMVDTGSEGSLLTPEVPERFSLRTDPQHTTLIISSDGHHHIVPNAFVQRLTLDSVHFDNLTFPLGVLPAFPTITPPLLGLIGMNLLSAYDLEMDLSNHQLTLWDVKLNSVMCRQPPQWKNLWLSLSAQRRNGRFMVPFTLDEHLGTALVDSGARSFILSADFTHKLGITQMQLGHDPGGQAEGLGMKKYHYYWHRFHHLRIGTENWPNPTLTVAPLHDHADLLLGAEWFQTHHLWLSSATGQIFVQASHKLREK